MFVTTNGGSTWQSVSAIPVGSGAGITGILFDPAIGGSVDGVTQTIFASSSGNGVYESTNGGQTWTQLSGGPSTVLYAAVSSTGVYYAVGTGNNNLWAYNGSWTQLAFTPMPGAGTSAGEQIASVAVDPANPSEIVVVDTTGAFNVSYDGGATWSDWYSPTAVSTDIPWEAAANSSPNNGSFLSAGGVAFNPLAANQIIMSNHAVLGPVDPQLGQYPAASILKVIKSKPIGEIEDETLILADQSEKAIFQLRQSVKALLEPKMGQEQAGELSRILTEGTWTHDYPITFEVAEELKLPVGTEIPEEVMQLMELYPQPVRRQSSVEYLSEPRRLERSPTGDGSR